MKYKYFVQNLLLSIVCCTVLLSGSFQVFAEDFSSTVDESESLEKYGMLPIYGRDVKDGTYPITVSCNSGMAIDSAALTADQGSLLLSLKMDGNLSCTTEIDALDQTFFFEGYDDDHKESLSFTFLAEASSLPTDALLVDLPDYGLIEAALKEYTSSGMNAAEKNLEARTKAEPVSIDLEDGEYSIELSISGGSGKAGVVSPTLLTVKDQKAYAEIIWSSSNYDYMIAAGEKFINEAEENAASVFHIPVTKLDAEMSVIADTTAMGTPHEVNYLFTFYSDSIGSASQMPQEAAKRVLLLAVAIIIFGGILNRFVNKKRKK